MSSDIRQFILYCLLVAALAWPLGVYMARVFAGNRTPLSLLAGPIERALCRLSGIDAGTGQSWVRYAAACLAFNLTGYLGLYAILRLQGHLPLNPEGFPGLSPALAFNVAVSFVTNTNWQAYVGETTMSYLSQMAGLPTPNFLSAATGIAVGAAVIRGFSGHKTTSIGNFWVDLTRAVLYMLLPLSIVGCLFLVWQGVPQNLSPTVTATTLEGAQQAIAQGPAASQIAIKQLGTNGGGFFNANSAVPYENPTPRSNLLEMVAILLIPAAFCFMFGRMSDMHQGRILIVDDEPQIRVFLRVALQVHDFEVVEAESGRDGVHKAALERPDLVVLDRGLPDVGLLTVADLPAAPAAVLSLRPPCHLHDLNAKAALTAKLARRPVPWATSGR
ncbi:potassium-transporting ATPase subunit KdpA [Amorphus sp. 3PC139-8]|uniref:potassium-transporting ATPase subunit KdpA n=1 Tax=Amorphus sp. 3PC139-8 TaxID=2735676 RepID=UPI00345C9A6A